MKRLPLYWVIGIAFFFSCTASQPAEVAKKSSSFTWDAATIYFLLTDRFNNGNKSNDFQHYEDAQPAPYRGFMGGDIAGVTQKLKEGYFTKLGVDAIWTTPILQNIAGSVDEGTGMSYAFHGYWTRDWTAFDSRFSTAEEFKEFVQTAHDKGIRVIMDVIINHTGPVTKYDSQWPDEWVRTGPRCQYKDAETTISCTLVDNLPDIKTESEEEVELPPFLVDKWKAEGRYEDEVKELDAFFEDTGYPRRPYYYIIKWLVDYIEEFGIDGFRVDTAKHTEAKVWKDLFDEAQKAFQRYKEKNGIPVEGEEDVDFYMVGEVYNYYAGAGRAYDYGDRKVDFYDYGFQSLVNFDFKGDANKSYEELFNKYDGLIHNEFKGVSFLNYASSHDDGGPFDLERKKPRETGTKLLLTQGAAQIYYGDEIARSLTVEAEGDARLRSFMDWEEVEAMEESKDTMSLLNHWRKLGQFRSNHSSITKGKHEKIGSSPYTFKRTLLNELLDDKVVIALDCERGEKKIAVNGVFEEGTVLRDFYSGYTSKVKNQEVNIVSNYDIVLLEEL